MGLHLQLNRIPRTHAHTDLLTTGYAGKLSFTCALIRLEASQQFADFRFRAEPS